MGVTVERERTMTVELPYIGEIYEKGRFRRLVTLVDSHCVEYALYTLEKRFKGSEWILYRHYLPEHKSWLRWAKGAEKLLSQAD